LGAERSLVVSFELMKVNFPGSFLEIKAIVLNGISTTKKKISEIEYFIYINLNFNVVSLKLRKGQRVIFLAKSKGLQVNVEYQYH
jgi:hypothetical protein